MSYFTNARRSGIRAGVLWIVAALASAAGLTLPAEEIPEPAREFRGVWLATVYNIDWPSKPGLPAAEQKLQLLAMLDRAAALNFNAVILQVRPQCDALYASEREPWSAFLSGTMGVSPGYDPLAFAIGEAHARGLELHAWFNPFRALANAKTPVSADHVTKRHPEWIRRYSTGLVLDPGVPEARAYSLGVILDVLRRYDVDGIHIDDYFYPYPVKAEPFPDDASYRRYVAGGGGLARDDWRRANTNQFIAALYRGIKAEKRAVKFGISPFGIWRPGVPATTIAYVDSYAHLFADSRRWLREGWCDYLAPQLYWPIQPPKQSFPVLLEWWRSENIAGRHVWPGIADDRIGATRLADENIAQIAITRAGPGTRGHLHWSAKNVLRNQGGIADRLRKDSYREPALVPASPWLGVTPPAPPLLSVAEDRLQWRAGDATPVRWWLLQTRKDGKWSQQLLPASQTSLPRPPASTIALRALDHAGNAGLPVELK